MFMWIEEFREYLTWEKRNSAHTVNAYYRDVNEFQNFLQENTEVSLDTLTKREIRLFISYQLQRKKSNKSINRMLSSLRSFYRFLLKTELLESNPFETIHSLKAERNVIIPLSSQEAQSLSPKKSGKISQKNERNQLILDLLYQTGMRRSELVELKKGDINFASNELKVLGKRNKERIIPVNENLIESISSYISNYDKNDTPYLFTGSSGKPLNPKTVYSIVRNQLNNITSKEKKGPHVLRHSLATHMLQNGAEINAVKELLGHSSLASTQVYTHLDLKKLSKLVSKTHPREKE